MRVSTRVLAALLSILMLCGLLPFSLFAVETDPDAGSSDNSGKTYAEQIVEYVTKNNGKLYYANDFSGEDKELTGDDKLASLVSGSCSLQIVPKVDKISVKDGSLYIQGTEAANDGNGADPFVQMSPGDINGASLVVEASFKLGAEGMPVGKYSLVYTKDYFKNNVTVDYNIVYLVVSEVKDAEGTVTGKDYSLVTGGTNKVLGKLTEDEFVNIKAVQSFSTNTTYIYVDGEYVTCDNLTNHKYNKFSDGGATISSPTVVRIAHFGNDSEIGGLYVDDLYVYTADVPYGCESCYGNGYIESVLRPYLSETGNRLLVANDFENATYKDGALTTGTQIVDSEYDVVNKYYTTNTDGTQWSIWSGYCGSGSLNFHNKLTLGTINEEDGNKYLSIDQNYPWNKDAYIDIIQNGYVAGTDFVYEISLRRYENTNWDGNIINFRLPDWGKGKTGTAEDGSTATYGGSGTAWLDVASFDAAGRIYVNDFASGSAVKVYVGQLYSTEFTDIAIAMHPSTGLAEIYINGYNICTFTFINPSLYPTTFTANGKTYTFDDFSSKNFTFQLIRANLQKGAGLTTRYTGGNDVDNLAVYTGSVPAVTVAEDAALPSGWVQNEDNQYWRYYTTSAGVVNGLNYAAGVALIGEQTVDGTKYYFENEGGYVSQVERVPLMDLEELYAQTKDGDFAGQIAQNTHLAPSTTVKGSGKWTYLWADIYKTSGPYDSTSGMLNSAMYLNINQTYSRNNKTVKFIPNSSLVVTKQTATHAATARLLKDGQMYWDLSDFAGVEFVTYADVKSQLYFFVIFHNDEIGTGTDGYIDSWSGWGQNKPSNYSKDWSITSNGWSSTTFYFGNYTHATDSNGLTAGIGRGGGSDRICLITFDTGWGNSFNGKSDYDTAKLYVDNIYGIKYVPVTEIPTTGLVKKDEGTYNYTTTWDYGTGWFNIDGADYYFYPYTGLMATGNAVVDGVGMQFDDEGKLITKTATGWFTVDGVKCIYINGTLQTGAFEYEGVNYYASPIGKIYSEIGEIGYNYDKAYAPTTFTDGKNFMVSQNFEDIAVGTTYGNLSGNTSITSTQIFTGKSYLNLVAKLTHYTIVDLNGNKALEVTNQGGISDSYVNINFKNTSKKNETTGLYEFTFEDTSGNTFSAVDENGKALDIVFESDIMLGSDWNADTTAFNAIDSSTADGSRKNSSSGITRINTQGYVYLANDSSKILCKLSDETFTNLAYVIHASEKTVDIYVNGVLMVSGYKFNFKDYGIVIAEGRMLQYPHEARGTAYLDNVYAYIGSTPASYDGTTASKSGWVTEGGVKRYYEDGLMRTSALEVEGEDGIKRIYYFDSQNGMCYGTANGLVDGKFYKDGQLAGSQWYTDDNGNTYYITADGTPAKGGFSVEGKGYYFNKSTGILESFGSTGSTITSVKDLLNANGKYSADYSNGGIVSSVKLNGFKSGFSVNLSEPNDISGYDAIKVEIYVGEKYDADFGIQFNNDNKMYIATDVVKDDNGNYKSATVTDEYIIKSTKDTKYWEAADTEKYIGVGGVTYRIHYSAEDDIYYFQKGSYLMAWGALDNFEPGWNTFLIKLSDCADNNKVDLTQITSVALAVSGWTLNGGNNQYAEGAENFDVRLGNIQLVKLEGVQSKPTTGWVNGSYYENSVLPTYGWVKYDGVDYYIGSDAKKVTGYQMIDGTYYEFYEDGALKGKVNGIASVNDIAKQGGKWTDVVVNKIFVDGIAQTGLQEVGEDKYFCDENGNIVTDTSVMVGDKVYKCDEDGKATLSKKAWYYDADGNAYYISAKGEIQKNSAVKIGDVYYYFGEDGKMQKNVMFTDARGNTRYFGEDGKSVSGVYTITVEEAEKIVFFDAKTFAMQKNYLHTTEDGKVMWFGAEGYAAVNAIAEVTVGDATKKAYFNEEGYKTVPEDGMINGQKYNFDEDGYIVSEAAKTYTVTIVINILGVAEKKEFTKNEGETFTFTPETLKCKKCTIQKFEDGTFVDVETISCTEEATYMVTYVNNHSLISVTLVEANCTQGGLKLKDGYDKAERCTECDYTTVEATDPLGHNPVDVAAKDPTCTETGNTAGVKCDRCDVYYTYTVIPAKGHTYDNGTINPDGSITYICSECETQTTKNELCGELGMTFDGSHYTMDGKKSEWVRINGRFYYFDNNGYLLINTESAKYTFGKYGYLTDGAVEWNGYMYLFVGGVMKINCTANVGLDCYIFDENGRGTLASAGEVTPGVVETVNNGTVYVKDDGKLLRAGWVEIDGSWYYFDKDYKMVTGKVVISGVEYIFGEDGKCQTQFGTVADNADGNKVYIGEDGKLVRSGWVQIDGKWYYFNRDNEMVKDCTFITADGEYTFDENGVCADYEG